MPLLEGDAEGLVLERDRADGTYESEVFVPIGTRCDSLSPRRLLELAEEAVARTSGAVTKTLMLSFVCEDGSVTHAAHMIDVEPPFLRLLEASKVAAPS